MSDPLDPHADEWAAMDDLDKIRFMVETDGWGMEAVGARADTTPPTPNYAYTLGVPAAVDFPDLAVFGLTPAASKGLLGLVVDARRGGTEIPLGVELVGLLDNELRCVFAPIDLREWGGWFTTAARWYDGADFAMVQLMYPDRNGFMPYEPGYEQRLRLAQPVLGDVTQP